MKEENRKITKSLSSLNFYVVQENTFGRHTPGTGQWLLNDKTFQHLISTSGGIMWCHGMRRYLCPHQDFH
jgi:hypothetical protein